MAFTTITRRCRTCRHIVSLPTKHTFYKCSCYNYKRDMDEWTRPDQTVPKLGLQIASDLHLEMKMQASLNCKTLIKPTAQTLLLAGDICQFDHPKFLKKLFDFLSERFEAIYYVPGNHEYYNTDIDRLVITKNQLLKQAKDISIGTNVHVLDNQSVIIPVPNHPNGSIRLIGTTLWSKVLHQYRTFIQQRVSDYRYIWTESRNSQFDRQTGVVQQTGTKAITVNDTLAWHQTAKHFLLEELQQAHQFDQIPVVVSHHAPLVEKTTDPKYLHGPSQSAFVSDLSSLVELAHTWVFGHTHWSCDFLHGSTRVTSNARGLGPQMLGLEYRPDKVI